MPVDVYGHSCHDICSAGVGLPTERGEDLSSKGIRWAHCMCDRKKFCVLLGGAADPGVLTACSRQHEERSSSCQIAHRLGQRRVSVCDITSRQVQQLCLRLCGHGVVLRRSPACGSIEVGAPFGTPTREGGERWGSWCSGVPHWIRDVPTSQSKIAEKSQRTSREHFTKRLLQQSAVALDK